jgi:hypothetical protein
MVRAGVAFEENIRLFADPKREPEKFNLYAGLSSLATEVERLRADVANLTRMVDELRRRG